MTATPTEPTGTIGPDDLAPLPTVAELAMPWLQGINLLYELATSDPAFDDFTMVGRSPELRDRSHELGRRIREAINLCASYAEACAVRSTSVTAMQAVRTAMETLVEVERLHWTEQERAEAILEAAP